MMTRLGHVIFRYRTTISPLLLLLLLLPGPSITADPFFAAVMGLVVAFAGQTVRAATIGLDYIVRGGRNHRVYAETLVTEGLFKHTRNPMYVGKFFMVAGAGLAANSWAALVAISAVYAFMYHAVVLAEEEYLRGKFGSAFDEYCKRTPRWLSRLGGVRETFADSKFDWTRVLTKEYSAPLGWTLPIAAIGLYNMSRLADSSYGLAKPAFLIFVAGLAVAFWLLAGWRKKSSARLRRSPSL
jgi:protein-S-isoprenylcysteine O-methyltransferase Ste14